MRPTASVAESRLRMALKVLPALGVAVLLFGLSWAVYRTQFDVVATVCGVVGLLLFLTLFVRAELANLRYYLHVTVYSALVLGIAVIVYLFAQQYTRRIDLTKQGLYSLSEESRARLRRLEEEVTITFMWQQPDIIRDVKDLFAGATDKIQWKVIDPIKDRLEAQKYGATVNLGDVYITTASGNSKRVSITEMGAQLANAENVLVNAIIEVTRKERPKIYFLAGHGEIAYEEPTEPPAPGTPREPTVAGLRKALNQRAMDTEPLRLVETGRVPEDAAMVVVAGPTRDLFAPEAQALKDYLARNGKLLVLLPGLPSSASSYETYPNLKSVLEPYGIQLPDEVIVDMSSRQILGFQYGNSAALYPLVSHYDTDCPITANVAARMAGTLVPLGPSRPVRIGQTPEGLTGWEFMKSSNASWSEPIATVLGGGRISAPPEDKIAPQPLGAAVGKPQPASRPGSVRLPVEDSVRLVVFGTDEIIQDHVLAQSQLANQLMLNTFNWLAQQEDLITVAPRVVEGTPIVLTDAQLRVIMVIVVVAIPAFLFFGGISYSLQRRRG